MKASYDQSEVKSAIARSISHTEIVTVSSDDPYDTLATIDTDESVADLDWAKENDGSFDVWGTRLGGDFRLHIVSAE